MTETLAFTIFGVGRSGTTALKRAANLHPRVFCTHEWQIAVRKNGPAPQFPEMLQTPAEFGLQHQLKKTAASLLEEKLAHGRSIVYGNKYPGYYLLMPILDFHAPDAKHTAIYRSLYGVTKSWDARAANPADLTWSRGQIGLFAIFEWLMLLDCLVQHGNRINVVPYDRAFFGPNAGSVYEEWIRWATGFRVPPVVARAFQNKLVDKQAPDAGRSSDSRYGEILARYHVPAIDSAINQLGFAPAKFVSAQFREFIDGVAEPLAEELVDWVRREGDAVNAYAATWIKPRRNRYALDRGANPNLYRALEILAQVFIPGVPAPQRPAVAGRIL